MSYTRESQKKLWGERYAEISQAPLFNEMTKEERVVGMTFNGIHGQRYSTDCTNENTHGDGPWTKKKERLLVMMVKGKPHVLYASKDDIVSYVFAALGIDGQAKDRADTQLTEMTEEKLNQLIALFDKKGGDPVEVSLGGRLVPLEYTVKTYFVPAADGSTHGISAQGQIGQHDWTFRDEEYMKLVTTAAVSMSEDGTLIALAYVVQDMPVSKGQLENEPVDPEDLGQEVAQISKDLERCRSTAQRDIARGAYSAV